MAKKENPRVSLQQFVGKKGKVAFLNNEKQLNKKKDHVILVGAGWCGYSQMGVPQLNTVCNDMKGRDKQCFVADITNPESKSVIDKLGLQAEGFPTSFCYNSKTKKYDVTAEGMKVVPDLKSELSKRGFKFY